MRIVNATSRLVRNVTYRVGDERLTKEEWPQNHPLRYSDKARWPKYGTHLPRLPRYTTDEIVLEGEEPSRVVTFHLAPVPYQWVAVTSEYTCYEGVKSKHGGLQERNRFKALLVAPINSNDAPMERSDWFMIPADDLASPYEIAEYRVSVANHKPIFLGVKKHGQ